MQELFKNIPQEIKQMAELWFNTAMQIDDAIIVTNMLKKFRGLCTEEQKDFVDFYFNMRLQQLIN